MDISPYVSAKNMSTVVMSVLRILGKFKVDEAELPKQTFSKLNFQEANLVSSRQVAEELHNLVNSTLHSDGTSRNGEKVVDFETTVSHGVNRTTGLVDVEGGVADAQLGALKFVMDKLASLVPANTTVSSAKTLFSKIKITMADQGASQKSFVHKLEQCRSEILPDVMSNWDALSEEEKKDLCDLYICPTT